MSNGPTSHANRGVPPSSGKALLAGCVTLLVAAVCVIMAIVYVKKV
jgi:hypothetical protein